MTLLRLSDEVLVVDSAPSEQPLLLTLEASPTGLRDRVATVAFEAALDLGNDCDTCQLVFARLPGGRSQPAVAEQLSNALRAGDVDVAAAETRRLLGQTLPPGNYLLSESRVVPHEVSPFGEGDYFVNEAIDLWGPDPFWALPHFTAVPYYRVKSDREGDFQFLVPVTPSEWLNPRRIDAYVPEIADPFGPVALTLSIFDEKGPADGPRTLGSIEEHRTLTHVILDGHHKINAAATTGQPVRVLTATAIDVGTCLEGWRDRFETLLRS